MSDYSELNRLAEAAKVDGEWYEEGCALYSYFDKTDADFMVGASPVAVLALIADLKKIEADRRACWAEFKVMGRHVDQLKAENEALRGAANELRRFAICEELHHDKLDWHEHGEPCKVLARIDAVLGNGEKTGG